ncbi:MAG: hypothetical protein JXR76_32645 [Deltaproteobacteria bacterium]|nr:hypothetical protein [Deltaproteobacteria bacterium]
MKNQLFIQAVWVVFAVVLFASTVAAKEDASVDNTDDATQTEPAAPAAVDVNTDGPAPPPQSGGGLAETPGVGYHSVGMRFRWIFLPKWFITMFGVNINAQNEKHPLISNLGFGVEYTYRKDNFDITAAIWGAQLDWEDPIYFKNGGEPESSWTEVRNGMSALLFTADFIWSTPITEMVAITYGVGVGMGITVGGDIIQTEAYRDDDGVLHPCDGAGNPGTMADNDQPYCEEGGEYHDVYDKLPVVPWINLLVGARIKPHEHFAIYVDTGFGIGFQMGIRGGYIF